MPDERPRVGGPPPDAIGDALARRVWAVVGASREPTKFGNMVYWELRAGGYTVRAVNPNATEVEGDRSWPRLADLPEVPDVVNFVTPPAVTAQVVDEALRLGVRRLWFQPGSEDAAALTRARNAGALVIRACAMTERRRRGARPAESVPPEGPEPPA